MQAQHWGQRLMLIALMAALIWGCKSPEKLYEKSVEHAPFDAIVVPGVPFDSSWSRIMKGRVLWSYHLYRRGITKNVMYSGSAVYSPYIESRIMAAYGEALGIPPEHIFTEENAEHSTENLAYSVGLAKAMGFDTIALATDPFQSKMLRTYARTIKHKIYFIPFIEDTLATLYQDVEINIDPLPAYQTNFVALPNRESWFKRTLGTMGFRVKKRYKNPDYYHNPTPQTE